MITAGVVMASCAAFADGMTPQQVAKAWVENFMNCKINAMGKLCTEDSQDYFELNKATFKKNVLNMTLEGVQTYKILDSKKGIGYTFVCVQNTKNAQDMAWIATKEDCGAWLVDIRVTVDRIWNNPNAKPLPLELLPAEKPAAAEAQKPAAPKIGPDKVAIKFFKAMAYKNQARCETCIASSSLETFKSTFKIFADSMAESVDVDTFECEAKNLKIEGAKASLLLYEKGSDDDPLPLTFVIENGEWKIDWNALMAKAREEAQKEEAASKDAE